MRNKQFPNYPDDTDYTTNAPSYYDDLAKKQKLIELLAKKIWEYEETLDLTLEEITNRLESYIDENDNLMRDRLNQWDLNLENFPENVELLLQEWLSDGTLDHIINETIFNWKLDTEIFEQFRDENTAKIDAISKRTVTVSVHDWEHLVPNKEDLPRYWYWGDAFQAAVDYVLQDQFIGGKIKLRSQQYSLEKPVNLFREQTYSHYGDVHETNNTSRYAPIPHVEFVGESREGTIILLNRDNTKQVLFDSYVENPEKISKVGFSFTMKDLRLVGDNYNGTPFRWHASTHVMFLHFDKVVFNKFDYGFMYDRELWEGYTTFNSCLFGDNNIGVQGFGDNSNFYNCNIQENRKHGLVVEKSFAFNFFGGKIQYNGRRYDTTIYSQIKFDNVTNVNFWGTYIEPATSLPPFEDNFGSSLIDITNDSPNTIGAVRASRNITFNGCYFNANKAQYIARLRGDTNVKGLTFNSCSFQQFRTGNTLIEISTTYGAKLEGVNISPTCSFRNMWDLNDEVNKNWAISYSQPNNDIIVANSNIISHEHRLNTGQITKTTGVVNMNGTTNRFGQSYTFEKISTGKVRITLLKENVGVGGSESQNNYPVIVTADATSPRFASVERVNNQSFIVNIFDLSGVPIDSVFSFEATTSTVTI